MLSLSSAEGALYSLAVEPNDTMKPSLHTYSKSSIFPSSILCMCFGLW